MKTKRKTVDSISIFVTKLLFIINCSLNYVDAEKSLPAPPDLVKNVKPEEISSVTLDVVDHFPCRNAGGVTWDEKLQLPDLSKAPVQRDPTRQGCYKVGGPVLIREPINSDLKIHLEMGHGVYGKEQTTWETCHGYDKRTQCGGFGGDCLYCDLCGREPKDHIKAAQRGMTMWLTFRNKVVNCREGLHELYIAEHGTTQEDDNLNSTNNEKQNRNSSESTTPPELYLHFCLPTKQQFYKSHGITRQLWNKLVEDLQARRAGDVPNAVAIFITIRMMQIDLTTELKKQRLMTKLFERQRPGQQMSLSLRARLPFTKIIWSNVGFIACHKIIGNIYLT